MALADRVNGAQSRLEAVLARLRMPLADIMNLKAGMVLALPQAGLDRISLEGCDGRLVAEGRLGQNRGMRAVRLNEMAVVQAGSGALAEATPDFGGGTEGFDDMEIDETMFQATGTD